MSLATDDNGDGDGDDDADDGMMALNVDRMTDICRHCMGWAGSAATAY